MNVIGRMADALIISAFWIGLIYAFIRLTAATRTALEGRLKDRPAWIVAAAAGILACSAIVAIAACTRSLGWAVTE